MEVNRRGDRLATADSRAAPLGVLNADETHDITQPDSSFRGPCQPRVWALQSLAWAAAGTLRHHGGF